MNSASVLDRLVPITTFNRGGASKVFERVNNMGPVFVLKNNAPVGVIISPEEYSRLAEVEEDYRLLLEATARLESSTSDRTYSRNEIMSEFGITQADLDSAEEPVIE